MLVDIIAGARPNFMKIAPVIEAIQKEQRRGTNIRYRLVHTGQHYDRNMSDSFFEQLGIPKPSINLEAGSGSQAEQTAAIMTRYEKVLLAARPDLIIVVGDVTSTMACAITAKKMGNVKVAHIEAGIRSNDMSMPEEINRIVTDSITDYFFTTTHTANENLRATGVPDERIFFVGNTMIDTLLKQAPLFHQPAFWNKLKLQAQQYLVLTLHRPNNVDNVADLKAILVAIIKASRGLPIIFPMHPRTAKTFEALGIRSPNLHVCEPLSYLQFNYLVQHSKAVITDSGGIQEETTVLHVPCITLRNNTERPETCSMGTNELIGTDPEAILPVMEKLFAGAWKKGNIPYMWDGKAADRIVSVLKNMV
ncbi:MAG: UDP-N-acetylglucosamine 2-epimerase [Bacteroidetes bacterium 46-16]|nr:MAG: UDP-N-acetylglucosamine 2-epimerase [Bacteroidetes bacterium 46-16]